MRERSRDQSMLRRLRGQHLPSRAGPRAALLKQRDELARTPGNVAVKRGDDSAMDQIATDRRIVAEYRFPYLAHTAMEPLNAAIRWDGDHAEAWVPSQLPTFDQTAIASRSPHAFPRRASRQAPHAQVGTSHHCRFGMRVPVGGSSACASGRTLVQHMVRADQFELGHSRQSEEWCPSGARALTRMIESLLIGRRRGFRREGIHEPAWESQNYGR